MARDVSSKVLALGVADIDGQLVMATRDSNPGLWLMMQTRYPLAHRVAEASCSKTLYIVFRRTKPRCFNSNLATANQKDEVVTMITSYS